MKLGFKDVGIVIGVTVIAFVAGIVADKLSGNYWIGYFVMMGTLILMPNLIALEKIIIPKRV